MVSFAHCNIYYDNIELKTRFRIQRQFKSKETFLQDKKKCNYSKQNSLFKTKIPIFYIFKKVFFSLKDCWMREPDFVINNLRRKTKLIWKKNVFV